MKDQILNYNKYFKVLYPLQPDNAYIKLILTY